MKKFLLVASLAAAVAPLVAMADASQLDEMKQKCEKERTSMFRDNNGTPTCDRLNKMYSDYDAQTQAATADLRKKCITEQASSFRANDGTPSCTKLDDALRDRTNDPIGAGFRYSKERGKNCYFNDAGVIQSCP